MTLATELPGIGDVMGSAAKNEVVLSIDIPQLRLMMFSSQAQ